MGANDPGRRVIGREPIRPERVRGIGGDGFAFVPNRFLREGFFASLSGDELRLYLLLVLASDRRGLSFYHYDSICSLLEMTVDEYVTARNGLIERDLIAYDGTRFQVLSLPSAPMPRAPRAVEPDVEPPTPGGDDARRELRATLLASLRHSID